MSLLYTAWVEIAIIFSKIPQTAGDEWLNGETLVRRAGVDAPSALFNPYKHEAFSCSSSPTERQEHHAENTAASIPSWI